MRKGNRLTEGRNVTRKKNGQTERGRKKRHCGPLKRTETKVERSREEKKNEELEQRTRRK